MSTNCNFDSKVKKKFEQFFDKSFINKIGKVSGFVQRKSKKISPYHFVLGFVMSCCKGKNTYMQWASQISLLTGKPVSKQAVFDRIHEYTKEFAKQLLQQVLLQLSGKNFTADLFKSFRKVLLGDSTTIGLPQELAKIFPGNRNQNGVQKAVARIQTVFDVKAMRYIKFSLRAFTQNDQSDSKNILDEVSKGDLVIRDLGYFSIPAFESIIEKKVHILSRLRYGVTLSEANGKLVSLKDLLRKKGGVDRWVYIGKEKKIWVRLVMIPVPAQQVLEKIRKAKNDRDKRCNHDEDYYKWLRFNVYITTVDKDVWTTEEVFKAYSVRWQIEIIFKSWKTGFNLNGILHEGCKDENRVRVTIYLMLLFICLFMQKIYVRYKNIIEAKMKIRISLIKLASYITTNFKEIIACSDKRLKEDIIRYCCYDKRNDRINMTDLYQKFAN